MPKSKSSNTPNFTGVGATLVGGTVNTCPADNETLFCQISRAFQVFSWILIVVLVIILAWSLVSVFMSSSKSKGGFFKQMFKGRG
jgi:hypothetical protein